MSTGQVSLIQWLHPFLLLRPARTRERGKMRWVDWYGLCPYVDREGLENTQEASIVGH